MSYKINAAGIIPARYSSTRLPGKPLLEIHGKPLLQWVWEAASGSGILSEIYVATDDIRILEICSGFGAKCRLTPPELASGTDRIAYLANMLKIKDDYIVNIQGDEPFLHGHIIDSLLKRLAKSDADVGTLVKRIREVDELNDPSVVKVAVKEDGTAMYFSRSPVPHLRDYPLAEWPVRSVFLKHIGVYAYRRDALERFVSLPQSDLEKTEKLEQLRLLEDGKKYLCVETDEDLVGVDTSDDLKKVTEILGERL